MHGSWPTATELKMPYLLCGEASSLPAGKMSRYVFQPCITDVRSQISAVGKWITDLGKNVTMILPDTNSAMTIAIISAKRRQSMAA